jgi:hypothetical protein
MNSFKSLSIAPLDRHNQQVSLKDYWWALPGSIQPGNWLRGNEEALDGWSILIESPESANLSCLDSCCEIDRDIGNYHNLHKKILNNLMILPR